MKKLYAIISFFLFAMTATANEYTDTLTVTVNGESVKQITTISITQGEDGKYTLSLNNFCLESPNEDGTVERIGVGNIVLADREGVTENGVTSITYKDDLVITEGNDPDIPLWMGTMLGPVPIEMVARFNETQLYCEIHIDLMTLLGQLIDVVFGAEPDKKAVDSSINLYDDLKSTEKDDSAFDLQGRKTNAMTRGKLYIVNGKKIINL